MLTSRIKPDVCVVSIPDLAFNEMVGLDNFVRLLLPSCNAIFIVTGEKFKQIYGKNVYTKQLKILSGNSMVSKVAHKLVDQMREAFWLIKLSRNFSIVLFHAGLGFNQLPIFTAWVLRKKVVIYQFGGNYLLEQKLMAIKSWEKIVKPINAAFSRINYLFATVIICEGGRQLARGDEIERYSDRIAWFVARDVDTKHYNITRPINERPTVVGYFGRLDPKKGIFNFVRAIPLVLKVQKDVRFLIAGAGPLKGKIELELESLNVTSNVDMVGFVENQEIPVLLNNLKLLVLPTYDDGVPEVLKEAMACGTLVAVTPVGGVPDIISDKVQAFLIRNNDPEGVAKTILEAIRHPNLDEIVKNGRMLIENTYGHEQMTQRYNELLQMALRN